MPALVDAVRFPSDPETTVLESNDVVVLLRSDVRSHVTTARERLLARLKGVLEPTSIRSGFVGAGLPKRLATAAGIPGADAIPDDAQLFLGFTSTQRSALGPTRIANLESLRGVTDQWPDGYFRHGTVMHLSHLFEDLEDWYSSATSSSASGPRSGRGSRLPRAREHFPRTRASSRRRRR